MNTQQIASIARQVVAVAAVVLGALTASLNSIHLPPAVSAVLTAAGAVILAVEHYVGDVSTGTTDAPKVVIAPIAGTEPVQVQPAVQAPHVPPAPDAPVPFE